MPPLHPPELGIAGSFCRNHGASRMNSTWGDFKGLRSRQTHAQTDTGLNSCRLWAWAQSTDTPTPSWGMPPVTVPYLAGLADPTPTLQPPPHYPPSCLGLCAGSKKE